LEGLKKELETCFIHVGGGDHAEQPSNTKPYQIEEDVAAESSRMTTLGEYFAWAQRCDECIEKLEEQCRAKRPRLSLGRNHSLVARIAQLEGLKKELEKRFIHVGGGGEIDTAFKNRILTGAVISVDYIDPRRFLEDARDVVLEHVRNAIDRHSNVKVNTMFNGECLHYFHTNEKLEAHTADCQRMNDCAIVLPNEEDKWLSFTNYNRKERIPFV
ncbi:hypothetical protein X777_10287, partial [Ooceraea biroi]